jgi:hypothetical protein
VPKIAHLCNKKYMLYAPCMAFFNFVSPWPETRNHPLASPLLSAGRRDDAGCRRVDEPTSVRKFRVAPHVARVLQTSNYYSNVPLDRLPARFRAGRSG